MVVVAANRDDPPELSTDILNHNNKYIDCIKLL